MEIRRTRKLSIQRMSEWFTSKLQAAGEMVAMMDVFVLPPRESCNSLVSLLSLYGTWGALSTKAVITLPSVRRLWLIVPEKIMIITITWPCIE